MVAKTVAKWVDLKAVMRVMSRVEQRVALSVA